MISLAIKIKLKSVTGSKDFCNKSTVRKRWSLKQEFNEEINSVYNFHIHIPFAYPKLFLVFVDDFRAKVWFSVLEKYVSHSNLLMLSLNLYAFIFHINMSC